MRAVAFLLGLAWLGGVPEPPLLNTGPEPPLLDSRPEPSLLDTGLIAESTGFVAVPGLAALPDLQDVPTGPMARRVLGVLAELAPEDLLDLRRCASPQKPGDLAGVPVCEFFLAGPTGARHLGVVRTPSGDLVAAEAGSGAALKLRPDRFENLAAGWPTYRGGFDLAGVGLPRGQVVALPPPYVPSPFTLDRRTIKGRIYPGDGLIFNPVERDLAREAMQVRLPKGYDPRHPAGLVVWVDPSPRGTPPEFIHAVADELNLIAIGTVNCGNERHVTERMQLALDAAETAQARFHVDPARIYVVGVSGGGHTGSILWGCFPDVFTGAVPIVGLYSYRTEPTGDGRAWRAKFAKPRGELLGRLKGNRLAVMSGPGDANYAECSVLAEGLERDGMAARGFLYEDMGHEYPMAERFAEAIRWVDELRRSDADARAQAADAGLAAYRAAHGEESAQTPEQRAALAGVINAGPWSDAAWRALELLGIDPTASAEAPAAPR